MTFFKKIFDKCVKKIYIILKLFAIASHAATYYITGSNGSFSASKVSAGGAAFNANATNKPIQDVIDAIRTDANNTAATIQFGNNTDVLDIGGEGISFDGSTSLSPRLAAITITGKITSDNPNIITLMRGASITSTADIIAKASYYGSVVTLRVYSNIDGSQENAGTLTISGGKVQAAGNSYKAVENNGTGTVTITGGLVFAYGSAISNVISGTYSTPNGNPAIIAWNSTAGTTYTAFTNLNITTAPTATTERSPTRWEPSQTPTTS